jgi:hypothetical protein
MPNNRMMSHNIGPDFNGVPSRPSPPSPPPRPPFSQYTKTRIQLGRSKDICRSILKIFIRIYFVGEDEVEFDQQNRMRSHNIGPDFNGVPSRPSPPSPPPRPPFSQYAKARIQLGR